MKTRFQLLFVFILGIFIPTIDAQNCYELVWGDEFNYQGLPDSTKWRFEVGAGGWGNNESQYYTNKRLENARVTDSVLVIEAIKESYEGAAYTSARIITHQKTEGWKYGKIEARIKLPYGQGIWPAFWMLGNDLFTGTSWPACGEIDIMELVGGGENRDDVVHGTVHWADASNNHAEYGNSYQLSEGIFADDFHVFSIEWSETFIKWFVDGQQYHIIDITASHLSEFHKNFFIILNLAVGGNWPGYPNASTVFPQQMIVDYVRVYQKNSSPEISGKTKVIKAESALQYKTVESEDYIYNWSVPEGAELIKGQGTHAIDVNWGCSSGEVSCEIITLCDTHQISLPVSLIDIEISGKTIVEEYEENLIYSIPTSLDASYMWELPEMVSSTTNLDTNRVSLNWGNIDGSLTVVVNNSCGIDTATINVVVSSQLPYPDMNQPHIVPGTIESVNYDYGGEGIAYHDKEPNNLGTGPRSDEGVDTEYNSEGANVGWIEAGEWLEYTVSVPEAKECDLEVRMASIYSTGEFKIKVNGVDRVTSIKSPNTGNWSSFTSVYIKDVPFYETDSILRVEILKGGFNLGRMIFADSIYTKANLTKSNSIAIYPTIARDNLNVKMKESSLFNYRIVDLQGVTHDTGIIEGSSTISINKLVSGLYIFIAEGNDELFTQQFIKQ